MIDAVICDWNGTLFEDLYEENFFRGLAKKAFLAPPAGFSDIFRICRFLGTKRECERLFGECHHLTEQEEIGRKIRTALELMNKNILENLPLKALRNVTGEYSKNASSRLDLRILDAIFEVKRDRNFFTGIISSGYKQGIIQVLANKGYSFDFVAANDFDIENGRVVKFRLDVFRNKGDILRDLSKRKGILPERTMYIGDDWQDVGCFGIVGHPVLSFFAKEDFKDKLLRENTNVFIPENKEELKTYMEVT